MLRLMKLWTLLSMFLVVVVLTFLLWVRMSKSEFAPPTSPVTGLAPCPDRPNCANSGDSLSESEIPPLHYTTSLKEAQQRLRIILTSLPRTRIVVDQPGYLAAEVRIWAVQFVDDVEFYFDPTEPIVHFRSASRIGWNDFGTNKNRMKTLERIFNETEPKDFRRVIPIEPEDIQSITPSQMPSTPKESPATPVFPLPPLSQPADSLSSADSLNSGSNRRGLRWRY